MQFLENYRYFYMKKRVITNFVYLSIIRMIDLTKFDKILFFSYDSADGKHCYF